MAYIGGMYRVFVYEYGSEYSRRINYIQSEKEARAIANAEWVKLNVKSVKIIRDGFDGRKRRKSVTIAEATKRN